MPKSEKTKVAIEFKLSESSPLYEILPVREDDYPDSENVLKPKVWNTKKEKAKDKFIKAMTKHQNMKTVKPTTSHSKIYRTEPVSFPSIPSAVKHNSNSSKNPYKAYI